VPYSIHPLKQEDRERAYALVRLMKPGLAIEHWQAFLDSALEPGASKRPQGVTVGTVGEDALVGLYTWEVQPNLDYGHVLTVDNMIATGPLNPEPLLNDMMANIECQAAAHSCDAIQILLPASEDNKSIDPTAQPLVSGFVKNGFSIVDRKLIKVRESRSFKQSGQQEI